ncbi:MAG: acyltransferase [Phycisphaerales bacterium JB063]
MTMTTPMHEHANAGPNPTDRPEPAAKTDAPKELAEESYIRAKLYGGDKSDLRRYADLVCGEGSSYWSLFKYEVLTCLLAGRRGALGLFLRKKLYPCLFRECGRGVIFGRNLTIRNGKNITLGDRVVMDDDCVLDARGAGEEGVRIGAGTILNRGVSIQAKIGPVHIGKECDIGMHSDVHAQGGVYIGDCVVLGGGGKISGGVFQIDRSDADDREQDRSTRGPIRIDSKCLIGMGSSFLDGVHVGEGVVIGAGSVVLKDIPAYSVAAGVPVRVLRERTSRDAVEVH